MAGLRKREANKDFDTSITSPLRNTRLTSLEEEHCRLCSLLVSTVTSSGTSRVETRKSYPFFKVKKEGEDLYVRLEAILGFELIPMSQENDDRICSGCYRKIPRIEDALDTIERWKGNVFKEYKKRNVLEEGVSGSNNIDDFFQDNSQQNATPGRVPKRLKRRTTSLPTRTKKSLSSDFADSESEQSHDFRDMFEPGEDRPENTNITVKDGANKRMSTEEVIELKALLHEWDKRYEEKFSINKEEITQEYQQQIHNLQKLVEESQNKISSAEYEMQMSRCNIEELQSHISLIQEEMFLKEEENKTLRTTRDRLMEEIEKNAMFFEEKEAEVAEWKEQYELQLKRYEDVAFDLAVIGPEMKQYRAILDIAESEIYLDDDLFPEPQIDPSVRTRVPIHDA
ncbi:uncharacterized protein LOC102807926 isoform X2 [Saccoglossus kowalevskii]|uniref:Lamin-B1-like n=1 Tax=Saccoglossus kowalevskii TaxID=10224 RepID=A0ABM0N074_SACKO|nr:PREDICTED: lamin-B1-like [Saccoglossus kowalevskii]